MANIPFQSALLHWYKRHKRDLPWRSSNNPYHIWLSEVILQQTRVDQGMPYYEKFVRHYPKLQDLANADIDSVLKDWEGLGYYSRARNLHQAAQQVVDQFDGQFPQSYADIIKLKGVGDYTASAISSIVFNEPQAVVDGNVYRVLSRFFGISEPINTSGGQKLFKAKAEEVLFQSDPGTFNQALMEFGALQCVPRNPSCESCPLSKECRAFEMGMIDQLPVKKKKKYDRQRYLNYVLLNCDKRIYVEQRPEGDIWARLYQFWAFETLAEESVDTVLNSISERLEVTYEVTGIEQLKPHKLSHQTLHLRVLEINLSVMPNLANAAGQWVPAGTLKTYAFPKPLRAFLDRKQLTLPLG